MGSFVESGIEVRLALDIDPQELERLKGALASGMNRWAEKANAEFMVELMRRSRAVVPMGKHSRHKHTDGFSHPGHLQRSGFIEVVASGTSSVTRSAYYDTPYARYQHAGESRFTGLPLKHSRAERQANYLYDAGYVSSRKSPLDLMFDDEREVGPPPAAMIAA